MKKQRVLLITARSDIGGGPKYTLDFALALQKDSILYVASPLEMPYGDAFLRISTEHIALPHRRFSVKVWFRLWRLVKNHQIDYVHSHGRGAGIYSRLLRFTGAKVIHSFHGIHREPSLMGRLKFLLDRVLNPLTNGFIFVSKSEENEAQRYGLGGTSSTVVGPIISISSSSEPVGYQSPIQLGSISRLTYQKGIDLLFSNLRSFYLNHPDINWQFHLAGAGDLEIVIPHEIRDRIQLHGAIQNPHMFLKNLDLYIANSRWESFNITVIEALSNHLPVLISDVPGHEYFIQAGVAKGFSLENSQDFTQKLYSLIKDRPPSKQNWVKQFHSQMNIEGIYSSILSPTRRSSKP